MANPLSVAFAAAALLPNLSGNIDRPLRYRPDGGDFVIENGSETFNRALYGPNTAFRAEGGDRPEFVLYLPGRGGNVRLGLRSPVGVKWIQDATRSVARYRPGEMLYELTDPLLGPQGRLEVRAIAAANQEAFLLQVTASGVRPGLELIFAYGGVNGERGARDGDIGTEKVPISRWFQLKPSFCMENRYAIGAGGFSLSARGERIDGACPEGMRLGLADANAWNDLSTLLASAAQVHVDSPVVLGSMPLPEKMPVYFALSRIPQATDADRDLGTYREVKSGLDEVRPSSEALVEPITPLTAAKAFAAAEARAAALRRRVSVETPDPFLDAAVAALNVAADAVWDERQKDIMHGAIAWRTRLLGWRGTYALDDLGWTERARDHFLSWASRQNTSPVPDHFPPPSEKTNLARNEAGLHSNGDLSGSHYDMNLVYIDALFRHLRWTGDVGLARQLWPVIERHLAWERRCFRREYGPQKLPLYEGYAAIWASDDLEYDGGGAAHASAYNYWHNRMAAEVASWIGRDGTAYAQEADRIARAMRTLLWVPEEGMFGEYKDYLGLQSVHPSAAVWSFYTTVDSELPTAAEARAMAGYLVRSIPRLPVRGPGVPSGLSTVAESSWMPYQWSLNNVVLAESLHTSLALWEAGCPDDAWEIAEGSLISGMYCGIAPGNVGAMSGLDVYRREAQRDFADGMGVMSRAVVEGLFGVKPDLLHGQVTVEPGFPEGWSHAALHHPSIEVEFARKGEVDRYTLVPAFPRPIELLLVVPARRTAATVLIDGTPIKAVESNEAGRRTLSIACGERLRAALEITWSGDPVPIYRLKAVPAVHPGPRDAAEIPEGETWEPVPLADAFNDSVTQIFKNAYRRPRSPFVSLALPKQGIGGWAGDVNETASIDDTGLRDVAAQGGGRIPVAHGLVFETPASPAAKNILFTSRWENYPSESTVPLSGRARRVYLLMAGSTNPMQSRFEDGQVIVRYADGTQAMLALRNPETWWPIERDYFIDDYQFPYDGPLPIRVDLKTGKVRFLDASAFKGEGREVPGGAATVLPLDLDPGKDLSSLTVRTTANDVVIGLMAATLLR